VLQPSPSHHFSFHYLPCSDGKTALALAMQEGKADVAEYLRSIGAPNKKAWSDSS
jgi:ankyrin repeat protein